MQRLYYKKSKKSNKKKRFRILAIGLVGIGLLTIVYTLLPFLSWQIYFAPVFAASNFAAPIPKKTVLSSTTFSTLVSNAVNTIAGVDSTNAQTWFPTFKGNTGVALVSQYYLSIPKLAIDHALVSTTDYDLSNHLINYGGTAIPPQHGTAVVFGHSTLPQLFNPKDYKTIFARAYLLKEGDTLKAHVQEVEYTYNIVAISVVDPTNTAIFSQDLTDSYLTLVTCTPPGTTWKRLVIKAKLQTI